MKTSTPIKAKAQPTPCYPHQLEQQQTQHTYFLDRDMAYTIAMQRNVIMDNQEKVLQYCYYDGEAFENAPENLINVRVENFTTFFIDNDLPLPGYLCGHDAEASAEQQAHMQQGFAGVIQEIIGMRATGKNAAAQGPKYQHTDTYFFDAGQAWQAAEQRNRVFCGHPTIDGLQVCYYDGDPIPEAPENMINLPFENILTFFLDTRLRIPESIGFPPLATDEQKQEIENLFLQVLDEIKRQRVETTSEMANAIRQQHPVISANEPLRIFFPSSRLTTVMQYASKNLAKAFEKLGHQILLSMETNEMEGIDMSHRLTEFYHYQPHVVVNINHLYNQFLNPEIINITWWQDAMPEIKQQKRGHWRERDFVYSAVPQLDTYLQACGASNITRQPFCIDTDEFKVTNHTNRENKIIFVGSSYIRQLEEHAKHKDALHALNTCFEAGEPITDAIIDRVAVDNGMERDYVFWHLFHYVVRDYSVRWLCQHSPIPVEVYGPDWEFDPIIKPFHKGILPHGQAVVDIYNSARYALVVHPFELNSQRLAEASACGCIPIVYDCRHSSDQPHWDNEVLYYKTRDDLISILSQGLGSPVPQVGDYYSYELFAKKILDRIHQLVEKS